MRRHRSDQPEILISALPATSVSFSADGQRPIILCPSGCGRWAYVVRGALKPHHQVGEVRCAGSGRPIRIDESRAEHLARLFKVQHAADGRRATAVHGVRPAPVPPPVCRLRTAA